jgi:hypothetical protein
VLHLVQRSDIFEGLDLKFSGAAEAKKPRLEENTLVPVIARHSGSRGGCARGQAVRAGQEYGWTCSWVSGGVGSNTALREALRERAAQEHIGSSYPEEVLYRQCRHGRGREHTSLRDGQHAGLDMNAVSRWSSITGLH